MLKKALWLMLLSLGVSARAFGIEQPASGVVVDTGRAELCMKGQCYPVLVGAATPKGDFPLQLIRTTRKGYGGDVLKFKETEKFIFAIHRVWTGKPSERRMERIVSPNAEDRKMTNGCINVTSDVYELLKAYKKVTIR
ncbi:hypothetical protein PL75_05065 [Neisseria arctica]|uniref:L,D-transpeptidase n=1 Tax=Neisseria arctica TaxID=1470200 RepID=A0A0J0YSE9_9NEIS|nr:hypothetical protein [Neisseria arctica]KLT73046.1 hypothetical protein PL75_05065 [Neisseria arctica]UOO86764.1 murein L,D-transpeptidase [Neisseria arctica]